MTHIFFFLKGNSMRSKNNSHEENKIVPTLNKMAFLDSQETDQILCRIVFVLLLSKTVTSTFSVAMDQEVAFPLSRKKIWNEYFWTMSQTQPTPRCLRLTQ